MTEGSTELSSGKREGKRLLPLLTGAIMVGFFAFMYLLFISESIPKDNIQMLNIAFGTLLGMATQVTNYYYGSSKEGNTEQEKPGK